MLCLLLAWSSLVAQISHCAPPPGEKDEKVEATTKNIVINIEAEAKNSSSVTTTLKPPEAENTTTKEEKETKETSSKGKKSG